MVSDDWKLNKKPELCFDAPQASYVIFDQSSKPCFCFSCELQQSAFVRVAFWGVYFSRTKPSIEIVSCQIKINVCILRDPCRRNWPLLPSIFLLQNRSTNNCSKSDEKPRCGHVLYRQRLSSKGNNSVTLQGGDAYDSTVFSPRFTRRVDNEALCY